jgi:Tfp pilus assembly protein PilO
METPTPITPKKPTSRLLTDYYGALFFCMVLIFLLASAIVLKPMLDGVKTTNAQVASTLAELNGETTYVNSLDQSISAAQTIPSTVLDKVDRALPRRQEIPQLLVLFGATGERDGVKISNVSFAESDLASRATATSSVSELTINMTVIAQNYPQIKKFIRDLEASLRILDIVGINVSSQGAESAYALQLKTYMYTPKVTAATPAQR